MRRVKAAAWISPGGMLWVRSMTGVLGAIPVITPFMVPTKLSWRPKSVVRVMDLRCAQIQWRRCAARGCFEGLVRGDWITVRG